MVRRDFAEKIRSCIRLADAPIVVGSGWQSGRRPPRCKALVASAFGEDGIEREVRSLRSELTPKSD